MLSPSPSKRSPSLKRERTNYRTDSGYRTVRTYETPVKQSSRVGSGVHAHHDDCALTRVSPTRSRSPRLRNELSDYRTESHYVTVREYESPRKVSTLEQDLRTTNFRNFAYDRQQVTKRSPHVKAEPTVYREDTSYRTVRVFDHTLHLDDKVEAESGRKDALESEVKRPQEKGDAKKDAGSVAKKLDFEQQDVKAVKETEKTRGPSAVDARASTITKSQNQCLFKTHEEQFLVKTLNRVVVYDKKLEEQKTILAQCLDFTMQGAFKKLVDDTGKNGGTKAKFEENLKNLGIFFTQTEFDAVYKRFDADGDGKISYHEFENVIYPVSLPYARMIRLRIDEQPLSKETLTLLLDFVRLIGDIEGAIEDLRVKVLRRVSLEEAFKALNSQARGNVQIYEFKKMLESHGFYPERNDLAALQNRVDLNEDGVVAEDEFKISMSPVKGGK